MVICRGQSGKWGKSDSRVRCHEWRLTGIDCFATVRVRDHVSRPCSCAAQVAHRDAPTQV